MPASSPPKATWQPVAAAIGWIIPGAGHFICGQRRRGITLAVTIGLLYLAGLVIGGIGSVDRQENTLWYYAQLFAGPVTIAVDQWHQAVKQPAKDILDDVSFPEVNQPDYSKLPYVQSVGRVNELGTLFCAVAGLLNLLVMVDVLYFRPPVDHEQLLAADAALPGRVLTREDAPS